MSVRRALPAPRRRGRREKDVAFDPARCGLAQDWRPADVSDVGAAKKGDIRLRHDAMRNAGRGRHARFLSREEAHALPTIGAAVGRQSRRRNKHGEYGDDATEREDTTNRTHEDPPCRGGSAAEGASIERLAASVMTDSSHRASLGSRYAAEATSSRRTGATRLAIRSIALISFR